MAQIRTSTLVFITLCCAVSVLAQKIPNKIRQPVFSSVYSDIAKGKSCRMIEEELIRCKPVGKYRIFAGFHNVLENVWIETLDGEEVARIPSINQPQFSRNTGKFEWRLADGKPFAIIARFEFFTPEDIEANRDLLPDRSKFAQILVVKGLPGYEQINYELDARRAENTNQKARDLADEAFMKKPELPLTEKDVSPRRLLAAQPDFTADMSCAKYEKTFGHGYGETFKSAKKGELYRHESSTYVDYFSPDNSPVRFTFKTKKFEVFTGITENHLWFETLESSALLAKDETLKFEIVGTESADFEIDGKTKKLELIKIKVTGATEVGGDWDKAEAFLYLAPDLQNLVVKTELIFPKAGRNCLLSNVSLNVPANLFKQFHDYRQQIDKNQLPPKR